MKFKKASQQQSAAQQPTAAPAWDTASRCTANESFPAAQPQLQPIRRSCYIGVDFGTSGTGCTYAFGDDPQRIRVVGNLPGEDKLAAKTTTALLYEIQDSGKWECIDWGTKAMQRYRFSNADDQTKWRLLEGKQFKLALAGFANLSRFGFPKSYAVPDDCPRTPEELIRDLLGRLHQHVVAYIQRHEKLDILSPDIDVNYCLSVPAGWSPGAKNIMKRAAEAAGFKKPVSTPSTLSSVNLDDSSIHSDQSRSAWSLSSPFGKSSTSGSGVSSSSASVSDDGSSLSGAFGGLEASAVCIVHEQEAAALSACVDPWGSWEDLRARPGDVWCIVDAGGGTVDIAMHQVEVGSQPGESQLSELLQSACLPYGSTVLDNMAEALLIKPMVASDTAYQRWKSSHPGDFLRQMRKWEDCKHEFDGDNETTLSFVESFLECLPAASPYRSQCIRHLDAATMKRVFDPVIGQITSQVKAMVSQPRRGGSKGADVLLLCGGFGANDYLKRELEKQCGDYIGGVVRPSDPIQAVVIGNTIHVLRPRSITARCSRVTYGLACCDVPRQECYQVGQIVTTPDRTLCAAHFKSLVHAGDIVQLDQRTEPWLAPIVPGSDRVKIGVYATTMETAVHVTEDHMMQVGEVEFRLHGSKNLQKSMRQMFNLKQKPVAASNSNTTIEISFLFGAAEIVVEAKKVGSKKAISVPIRFLNEPAISPVVLPAE